MVMHFLATSDSPVSDSDYSATINVLSSNWASSFDSDLGDELMCCLRDSISDRRRAASYLMCWFALVEPC